MRLTATSQAHIKLEAFGLAIADATKAIELDSNNVKVRHTFGRLGHVETHNWIRLITGAPSRIPLSYITVTL